MNRKESLVETHINNGRILLKQFLLPQTNRQKIFYPYLINKMFTNNDINFEALKRKAYNGRWATLEDGIIPLTAADPDFRTAPEMNRESLTI
jgi:hypothetical protein